VTSIQDNDKVQGDGDKTVLWVRDEGDVAKPAGSGAVAPANIVYAVAAATPVPASQRSAGDGLWHFVDEVATLVGDRHFGIRLGQEIGSR
jgi:hypothetical protein